MEMWREHLVTDSTGVVEFIQYILYRHSDINNELVKQSVEATMTVSWRVQYIAINQEPITNHRTTRFPAHFAISVSVFRKTSINLPQLLESSDSKSELNWLKR